LSVARKKAKSKKWRDEALVESEMRRHKDVEVVFRRAEQSSFSPK